MTKKDVKVFCEEFAYKFITDQSQEKEFGNVTGKDMQVLRQRLESYLSIELEDFLEQNEIRS